MTVSLDDVERLAAVRVPEDTWDYVSGGSGDERLLRANRLAFDDVALIPRVLAGIKECRTATRLVRSPASMPLALAPMAYQKLLHPEGELASAAAAAAGGVPFVVSTMSSQPVERIAETGAVLWFQLYWLRDRDRVAELVERAENAGCEALMLTVDVPVMARRRRDLRNEFTLPPHISAVHLGEPVTRANSRVVASSAVAAHTGSAFDPTLSWADVAWLRERTKLPLVLKGILHPRDAEHAVTAGVSAVVVSNHGGRQFDAAPASVAALPSVSAAVRGRCEVLLDSGVRTGTDIVRALALGASGVLLGRPVLWGLGMDGEAGVGHVLSLLRAELVQSLTLAGCADVLAARELCAVSRSRGNP